MVTVRVTSAWQMKDDPPDYNPDYLLMTLWGTSGVTSGVIRCVDQVCH